MNQSEKLRRKQTQIYTTFASNYKQNIHADKIY